MPAGPAHGSDALAAGGEEAGLPGLPRESGLDPGFPLCSVRGDGQGAGTAAPPDGDMRIRRPAGVNSKLFTKFM